MPTDRVLPSSPRLDSNSEGEDIDVESEEPVKILETQGTFDEIVVWGHEILPAADDSFIKGLEEWVRFSETVDLMLFRFPLKYLSDSPHYRSTGLQIQLQAMLRSKLNWFYRTKR